jgi:hypothetical protein
MVRSPGTQLSLMVLGVLLLMLGAVGHVAGARAQPLLGIDLSVQFASLFAGFALLAIITPLVAGGGAEVFPRAQLIAYPVRGGTWFLTSVLLAPLNLVWVAQAFTVTVLTGYVTAASPHPWAGQLVTWTYLVAATMAGQASAWWLVGLRATRRGRWMGWTGAALLAALGAGAWQVWGLDTLLANSPTTTIALATVDAAHLRWGQVAGPLIVVVGVAAASVWLGARACEWQASRPGDVTLRADLRRYPRRRPRSSLLATVHVVDVASVLRSTPLRRGLLVLAVLPGLLAAPVHLDWSQLVLLPGLVLAGAGLLFAVNVFALDGPGALLLAASPAPARTLLVSKGLVVVEACLFTAGTTVLAGAVTSRGSPSAGELAALGGGVTAQTMVVLALCLRWSLHHPQRADLHDRRDTPAPPGAMARYAAVLAVTTTGISLILGGLGQVGGALSAGAGAAGIGLLAVRSLLATDRAWADEATRARVAFAVATG